MDTHWKLFRLSRISKQQVKLKNFQKQMNVLECKNEESSKNHLRISSVPLWKMKVCTMFEIGWSHRLRNLDVIFEVWLLAKPIELAKNKDKTRNVSCKSIVVTFSTFRHRTLFYRNRSKLKNAKVWLDLTKKRYKIFTDVIDFVKAYKNIDCVPIEGIF